MRICMFGIVLFCGLVWSAIRVAAGESVSSGGAWSASIDPWPTLLTDAPPEAGPVVPFVRRAVELFDTTAQTRHNATELQDEIGEIHARLAAVNAKLDVTVDERGRLMHRLTEFEHRERECLESLRGQLETALKEELSQALRRNADELRRRVAMKLQLFDARRTDALEETLDEEFRLRERQLEELRQEVDLQSQEFLNRLAHVGTDVAAAQAIRRDMTETLARRKAEFEARRNRLTTEREAFVLAQRSDFTEHVTQQLRGEQQQRLRLREAEFRAGMARLLQQTNHEETDQLQELHQEIENVTRRYSQLVQSRALWQARSEALNQQLAAKIQRVDELEAAQTTALAKLEEALQTFAPSERRGSVFAWFGDMIHRLPVEVGTQLEWLRRRVESRLARVQQAETQRRLVRDRQMALQLSRELELRYQQARARQQQEQETKARKAQELLARVDQLDRRGQFDEALKLVSKAQEIDPSHAGTVALVRERLMAAREQVVRRAQTEQVERLFARAMDLFKRERYEEAVSLFQQVVAQEALVESPSPPRVEVGNR